MTLTEWCAGKVMRVLQERLHKAEAECRLHKAECNDRSAEAECSDRSTPLEPESSLPRLREQLLSQQLQSAQTKVLHRLLCLRLWLLLRLRLCQWLCQQRVSGPVVSGSVSNCALAAVESGWGARQVSWRCNWNKQTSMLKRWKLSYRWCRCRYTSIVCLTLSFSVCVTVYLSRCLDLSLCLSLCVSHTVCAGAARGACKGVAGTRRSIHTLGIV